MIEIVGWVAAVLTTVSFVPQVLQTLRTRNVSGISIPMYVAYCSGIGLWTIYGAVKGSVPLTVANTITLALACAVLVLALRYRTRPNL